MPLFINQQTVVTPLRAGRGRDRTAWCEACRIHGVGSFWNLPRSALLARTELHRVLLRGC